jgi:hypothetical protein
MIGRKESNAGLIGRSTKTAKQTPWLHPKTTSVPGGETEIDLRAETGIADLRLLCHSLDGRCWYGESEAGGSEGAPAPYVITLGRDGATGRMEYRDMLEVAEGGLYRGGGQISNMPCQAGRDWIMTPRAFYAAHNLTGKALCVEIKTDRAYFQTSSDRVCHNFGFSEDWGWLYREHLPRNIYSPGIFYAPPSWEQTNRVFGGFQILRGWLVPREDYGRAAKKTTPFSEGNESVDEDRGAFWSRHAIPYEVLEPGDPEATGNYFLLVAPERFLETKRLRHAEFKRVAAEDYGVFVANGELFVRSPRYAGHGLAVPACHEFAAAGGAPFHKAYYIVQANDYNAKASNYPGFDWGSSVIGSVGGSAALIEVEPFDPGDLASATAPSATRLLPTGRYIPLTEPVSPVDALGRQDFPQMRQMSGPEQEQAAFYINDGAVGTPTPAVGISDAEDLLVFVGGEGGESEAWAYRGAKAHFMPGPCKMAGAYGRYLASTDGHGATFVTDIKDSLYRRVFDGAGSLAFGYNVSGGMEKTSVSLVSHTEEAAVRFADLDSGESPCRFASYSEEWGSASCNPFDYRLLRADEGDFEGHMPGAYPIILGPSHTADEDQAAVEEIYRYYTRAVGTGGTPYPWIVAEGYAALAGRIAMLSARRSGSTFKMIDPDTGEISPPLGEIEAMLYGEDWSSSEAYPGWEYILLKDFEFSRVSQIASSINFSRGEITITENIERLAGRAYCPPQVPGELGAWIDGNAVIITIDRAWTSSRTFTKPIPLDATGWVSPYDMHWNGKGSLGPDSLAYVKKERPDPNIVGYPTPTPAAAKTAVADYCMCNEFWERIMVNARRGYTTPNISNYASTPLHISPMDLGFSVVVSVNNGVMERIMQENKFSQSVARRHHPTIASLPPPGFKPWEEPAASAGGDELCFAHFAKAGEFFKTRPLYFDAGSPGQEIDTYRAEKQMYVIYASAGATMVEPGTGSSFGNYAFSQGYCVVVRCDVDADKYNTLVDILRSAP